MKPSSILIAAKALISDPANWIQGDLAKDSSGLLISPLADTATCFCSMGAMLRVAKQHVHQQSDMQRASDCLYNGFAHGVVEMNDALSHAAVMACWDKAIQMAKDTEMIG